MSPAPKPLNVSVLKLLQTEGKLQSPVCFVVRDHYRSPMFPLLPCLQRLPALLSPICPIFPTATYTQLLSLAFSKCGHSWPFPSEHWGSVHCQDLVRTPKVSFKMTAAYTFLLFPVWHDQKQRNNQIFKFIVNIIIIIIIIWQSYIQWAFWKLHSWPFQPFLWM